MFKPLRKMPITNAPMTVPEIVPTPPESDVPPITVNATVLIIIVLVLVVYGVLSSPKKNPPKKG